MRIFQDLLNLFFPDSCVVCETLLTENEKHICLTCLSKIPQTNHFQREENKLETFLAGRFPFKRIASFSYFVKDGMVQKMIHELKYRNNPEIGVFLGELCGTKIQASSFFQPIDFLVPVPLHPQKEKQRGYNQAQKIAEGIANKTNIVVSDNNLIRVKENTTQTKQDKYSRWENTEGIFDIRIPEDFEGKSLLLIDDIITTGSTIENCVKAIRNKCDAEINIFTIGSAF